ncbi:hypothetical protein HAX54_023914, partial [Datura stramonium]|nr:hypothetical protein [Datura stramonium]
VMASSTNKGKEIEVAGKGLKWLQTGIKGSSSLAKFPTIHDKVHEFGLGYICVDPEECNLTLVKEFYTNWNTSFGESNKVRIRGQ